MMFRDFIRNQTQLDYQVADYLAHELQRKWPQLNAQTRIEYTSYPTVKIPRPVLAKVRFEDMVIADTWKRWWNLLFWYRAPETIEDRMRYSQDVVRQLLRLPTLIRKSLNGQIAIEKRKEQELMIAPRPIVDEVQLERFGWTTYRDGGVFICGYYAPTDTLFVYRR